MSDILAKPRVKPRADVHFRLCLTTATGQQSFACFATMREEAAWLQTQQLGSVEARLSLVDGPDCFYCRAKD